MYEPEYGRFMSVDAMWTLYEGVQPYHYSLNQPVSLLDNGGQWVQAMNVGAQQAIRESVPEQYRSSIKFGDDGILDVASVKEAAKGADVESNIAILSRLAENESTVQVSVADEFEWKDAKSGKTETRKFSVDTWTNGGELPELGITLIPTKDMKSANMPAGTPSSNTGVTQVIINPKVQYASKRGETACDELFGHFRFLLLAKIGKADGAGHIRSDKSSNSKLNEAVKKAQKESKE